ncbi:MAG: shikimate kinase [Oscillospiraceae bacterium]|nr:shikimate kinase [Oscillospiraceae bacterium]
MKKKIKKAIFLCGFMGCGKSHIGRLIAEKLELPFMDSDEQIEESIGKPISQIFDEYGEDAFRRMETVTLAAICGVCDNENVSGAPKSIVVALGGGAILNPMNVALINKYGTSIFVDVDFETCYERIKRDVEKTRPLAAEKSHEELLELYNNRKKLYIKNSRHTIDGNADINHIVRSITEIHAHL